LPWAFRLRFRAAGQVGDAHQAAFSGGLDLGGEVLAGDALAFSRPEVKGSLAGEVERQGLELQVLISITVVLLYG